MKRVIERCPNCGVEHDDPVGGACEVCGTALRWWCRVHGPQIGFMDTPACPRCAAEAARPAPPPRPAPPRPAPPRPAPPRAPSPRPPAPTRRPPYEVPPAAAEPRADPWREERDPRVVFREHAEDLAPYAAAGAGFLVRLMLALVMVVRTVLLWAFLGAIGGAIYASTSGMQVDLLWAAMAGAMIGGGIGLFIGTIRGLRILFAPPPDGPRS